MSRGAQNLKMGPDALGTAENEFERKTRKRDPTPRYRRQKIEKLNLLV
jgi:hypothetical protein